jgi:hypothetical protein
MRIIQKFILDTSNVSPDGETREFSVIGDPNSVFELQITNEDSPKKYHNFSTGSFTTTKKSLKKVIPSTGIYTGKITFPSITDDDHYDVFLFAQNQYNTFHADYKEVRLADGSIDVNASNGSNSAVLKRKLLQFVDASVTISAASPNSVTAWGSVSVAATTTGSNAFSGTRSGYLNKKPFSITVTAASNRIIKINRQPTVNDIYVTDQRNIASAFAIEDEDVSSGYYRFKINTNSGVHGLAEGMSVIGTNVTAGSKLGRYETTITETIESDEAVVDADVIDQQLDEINALIDQLLEEAAFDPENEEQVQEIYNQVEVLRDVANDEAGLLERDSDIITPVVHEIQTVKHSSPAVDTLGFEPTITNGYITKQLGNITFDTKQVAGLADDNNVNFYGYGYDHITSLSNSRIIITDLKVELTDVTTTVNDSDANGTDALSTFDVASVVGIMDDVSVMSGVNVNASDVNPTVTNISSNTITVSPGHHVLQNGQTLTFTQASRIATITGNIEVLEFGNAASQDGATVLYFDLEKFLTAV